jgi:hypothetical protein
MYRGYIALWRKIEDHPFAQEAREFSKFEAWIDLLMQAQHEDEPKDVVLGMKILQCHYSETLKSNVTWARRWNWTESKVRRFLKLLKKMGQIEIKNEGVTTRIKIINYSSYDPKRRTNNDDVTSTRRGSDEQVTTDKNAKNEKNEKNDTNTPPYPPKGEKVIYPDWLNQKLWNEFKAHRRRLGKAMTPHAEKLNINKIEKLMEYGHKPEDLINLAIEKGWQGIYPPKNTGINTNLSPKQQRNAQVLQDFIENGD